MAEFVPHPAREAALRALTRDRSVILAPGDLVYLLAALDAARRERGRLRDALWQFGTHARACNHLTAGCDCGLRAAWDGPPPAGEGT